MKNQYDYIICGAGAAGLSLAYRLADKAFQRLNILIIDKDTKQKDDRTWGIWTEGDGTFDHLAVKEWEKIKFKNENIEKVLEIKPFTYKQIRGIDFYNYTLDKIRTAPNITFINEEIITVSVVEDIAIISTKSNKTYRAKWVFDSILKANIDKEKYNYVDQHFKGWFIKTTSNAFDNEVATIMDFNIPQEEECRFMYILPTSETEALVEFAIFSNNILEESEYDHIIENYIHSQLGISEYEIVETEFGIIPMTTYPFENFNQQRITKIGTAGSAAKASTGYAFLHIQDQVDYLIKKIKAGENPVFHKQFYDNKFRWFDNILLNVLLNKRARLADVFGDMFDKLPAPILLKFLSNKTSFWEELKVISKPSKLPFLKAALNEFWKTN